MFREYVNLVNESVIEGIGNGVTMFLETLNDDIELDSVFESNGGVENVVAKIFEKNGLSVTPLDENEGLSDDFDKKLDNILAQLKDEGIVD